MSQNKLKVGWFSFSCCEDSTIIFTELLNEHYMTWRKVIEFKSALVLQKQHTVEDMDVAFVEGAITAEEQAETLKNIRAHAKKLVAIGSCACAGLPSGERNRFTPEKQKEIAFLIERFKYAPSVRKLSEVVPVDVQVPGCPMDEKSFLKALNGLLLEFGIMSQEGASTVSNSAPGA